MKNHSILFLTTAMLLIAARTDAQSLPRKVVTGTVTNERNERVSGMKVELRRDSIVATEYTDSCGVFRFAPVEAGGYGLGVAKDFDWYGLSSTFISLVQDANVDLKVHLNYRRVQCGYTEIKGNGEINSRQNASGVFGTVQDRTGKVLTSATLEVLKPDLGTTGFKTLSDIDGYFVIKPIPEGSYILRVAANGIGSEDYLFEISAGEKTELNIKMTKPTVDYFLPLRNGNAPMR